LAVKPRVLLFASEYPQISQTYVLSEIEALESECDVFVVTRSRANLPCSNHGPFEHTRDFERMLAIIRYWGPSVLHAHYVSFAPLLARLSAHEGIPYTIRAHSFDAMADGPPIPIGEHCRGVLAFPFTRGNLIARGVPDEKIFDCRAVVRVSRFLDRGPNGDRVLNVGACQPKKDFASYVDLAAKMPGERFDLYAIGYDFDAIDAYNAQRGNPVRVHRAVEPHEMPPVYKSHRWLVYTACRKLGTVGWPIAVTEAQASGVGVCMPNLRPDLRDHLGGAGFLYDSIDELPSILSQPVPDEIRARGFEVAQRSDIDVHKNLLYSLWGIAA
jgi:hypothetical protein